MDCNIHGVIEHKHSVWSPLFRIESLGRHYEAFSALAGVRGDLKPVVEPRGIPFDFVCWHGEDCTETSCHECPRSPDSHSATWLTDIEFKVAAVLAFGGAPPRDWAAVDAALQALGSKGRVVLWFDN